MKASNNNASRIDCVTFFTIASRHRWEEVANFFQNEDPLHEYRHSFEFHNATEKIVSPVFGVSQNERADGIDLRWLLERKSKKIKSDSDLLCFMSSMQKEAEAKRANKEELKATAKAEADIAAQLLVAVEKITHL